MTIGVTASFNSGEWAPALYARVDMQKYRSAAALLENFFVDYRGGASTRPGTEYILQCFNSSKAVRLITFQASFEVGYVLEFGDQYLRFFFDGAPVLETALNITSATQANPCVITVPGNTYVVGDWIEIVGINGMTQLNGNFYIVSAVAGNLVTLSDLFGASVNSTSFGAYTSGGTAARVYKITTPFLAADLALLKFAQNVNQMIICHTSYPTQVLTLITANSWTLLPLVIGSTAPVPTNIHLQAAVITSGNVGYSYTVTSIDATGNESSAGTAGAIGTLADLRTTPGSIAILWDDMSGSGAVEYNVYKANVSYFNTVPPGQTYGYIGTTKINQLIDSNIAADFAVTPPIAENPFVGSGIGSVTVTAPGTYTSVPTVNATGTSTITAQLSAVLSVHGTPTVGAGGAGFAVNDTVLFSNGVILTVATVAAGVITAFNVMGATNTSAGAITAGNTPTNPVAMVSTSGGGSGATANLTWGVGSITILNPGAGYTATPTISFGSGAATATATLSGASNGYPAVPCFFDQRLVLAGQTGSPQSFYMSQVGKYTNYNISSPSQASDAISGTLVSQQLNTIKAMIPQPAGLLILTDKASWLVNGGSGAGSPVSPSALVANAQSFNGCSDVPPIVANFDVLYVQAKGSIVRDSAYNIYANVYTGTDISILASHLFYGHTVTEWAWAEEPFKVVWAIRDDGIMLTLTFLKEQEFIGWAHSETTGGLFKSVCAVTEQTSTTGSVDAIYTVVQRTVRSQTVKYIERVTERTLTNGVVDAWCVDAGLQYSGAPRSSFSGATHLAGLTVTGLADGVVIPPFTMNTDGTFTLSAPASKVTVGLGYTCNLQTLPLDLGEPTVQGKVKKIQAVDVRVADTLGLSIGSSFTTLKSMKDLVIGNVSSMLTGQASQVVTDLINGDAFMILDPTYTVPGQFCIQQSQPLPATILGVFPRISYDDDR